MTNVAVVVLDTLRKDVFDKYFSWLPGTRYENAWSTANYTVPVHGSLFGGMYPSELGVHAKSETFDSPQPSLAERLSEAGYTTRAFSANPLVSKIRQFETGFQEFERGWHIEAAREDVFDWSGTFGNATLPGPLGYPESVLKCLLDRETPTMESLRAGWKMFSAPDDGAKEALSTARNWRFGDEEFLFVNLMEAHGPYWPPEEYQTVSIRGDDVRNGSETVPGGDADFTNHRLAYEDCSRYLSDMYQKIFEELQDSFDYVITLSDHGELFGEHGASAHYYGLFEELTNVPLVVSGDGMPDESRFHVTSVLDIHRTVLDLAGIEAPSRGRNLLETPDESRSVLTEFRGFRPHRRSILEDRGFDAEVIDRYDVELCGVAMPENYYGTEAVDQGFVERGDPIWDPDDVLAELKEDRDVREVTDDVQELAESTLSRLEHLGYA